MDYLKKISTFFYGLTNPHPTRDWFIAFIVASLIAIALAVVAVYFFIGIQLGFIIGTETSDGVNTPTVSRERISRTLETYEQRKTNFDAGNYQAPEVTDPAR